MEPILFAVIAALWALVLAIGGGLLKRVLSKLDDVALTVTSLSIEFASLKARVEKNS